MDVQNVGPLARPQAKDGPIASLAKPSINPPTTAKMIASMEKKRKELEAKRLKEEQRLKEEEARKAKLKKVPSSAIRSWHPMSTRIYRTTQRNSRLRPPPANYNAKRRSASQNGTGRTPERPWKNVSNLGNC